MYREHCIICVQFTLLCDQHNFSEPEFVGYVLWCNNFYICIANDVGIFIASYIFCDQYVYINGDSSGNCILVDVCSRRDACICNYDNTYTAFLSGCVEALFWIYL